MAVKNNHKVILIKLKKKVGELERKEKQAKKQLGLALKKIRKLARSYESRLAAKMRIMKRKVENAKASSYAKMAIQFERQILQGVEAKVRALASVLARIEKNHAANLKKKIAKKGKPSRKTKRSV